MEHTQGAGFDFNSIMDFGNITEFQVADESFLKPVEGNTSAAGFNFFAGDEGIDTTGSHFDLGSQQSFQSVFPETGFAMQQNLSMDNTMAGASAWNSLSPITRMDDFSNTNTTSFDSIYQSQQLRNIHHKRSLPLDVQDFPQSKRHESSEYANASFSPFMTPASVTGSSWTMDTQPTPSSVSDIGLSDEAADVCATWFSKYAVLPSDRHIESLGQLTGESHNAIRHWFGQMLKQGMAGHDSAYKSQTSLSQQDQILGDVSFQTVATDISCTHDTTSSPAAPAPRGGRKGCTPTSRPELLSRDPNKIYQCTRKCGKRYGRKCDWKRNEEEGYPSKSWTCILCKNQGMEKVKPCFRKYHFSQHFRNIHPGLNSADYEAESVVHSDTSFPRKCGFCPHRFTSRQNRIDHIADHFKQGWSMDAWNDEDEESADSDNLDDDDDDKPDSDGFEGPSDDQSGKDSQDQPGPKRDGNGRNGRGGQHPPSGFGQFQLSQLKDSGPSDQWSAVDLQSDSWNKQAYADDDLQDGIESGLQRPLQEQRSQQEERPLQGERSQQEQPSQQKQLPMQEQHSMHEQFSIPEQQPSQPECSIQEQCSSRSYPRQNTAEGYHTNPVARNAVTGALTNTTTQKQMPIVKLEDLAELLTTPSLLQERGTLVSPEYDSPPNPKLAGAISRVSNAGVAVAQQYGGPVSNPPSLVLPGTDGLCPAEIPQPDEKLDIESSAESSSKIPRDRLRLLTLEGGGIRDSTLIILLEHLMGELKNEGDVPGGRARLRDFFDTIGGTSTGGLIARMLGRVGVEPSAIFDFVEDMSRASKEQLIFATSSPSDSALRPPRPPLPLPSELNTYADLSDRTTTVQDGTDSGMNHTFGTDSGMDPTSKSKNSFRDREAQLSIHSEVRSEKFPNAYGHIVSISQDVSVAQDVSDSQDVSISHDISISQDVSTNYRDPGADSLGAKEDAESNMIVISSLIDNTISSSSRPSRRHRPSLQELKEQPSSLSSKVSEMNVSAVNFLQKSQSFLSVKLLGTGGFSTVDEVVHRETNLRVSRKTLKNREHSAMEELKKEVNVLQKLRHPHIIRFLGAYSKGNKMSILLSPVAETTLAVWLERSLVEQSPGLTETVVKMFGCLVSSIRYLHEQRPVVKHMDIKPQNILVMHGNQEFPHIVLSDFGVSSSDDNTLPGRRTKPLTRQYCAPEVPSGTAREQAADIWSLGCVFVEMAGMAFSQNNSRWLEFRREFSGSEGKYYWQNIPRLHEWLSGFIDQASTSMEATVLSAITSMLNGEPTERPEAAALTLVFTPAPCCLGWANEKASFPGPTEELETVEMLVRQDGVDCCAQLHPYRNDNHKQETEPFTRALNWLDECSHHHEVCQRQASHASFLPTRLVDLHLHGTNSSPESVIRIVNSTDIEPKGVPTKYAVISHVWGHLDLTLSSDRLPQMQNAVASDMLPTTIKDAMTVAKNIGYRYIWADSLCILQDSQLDKRRECASMASVYRNAGLTIVAHETTTTGLGDMLPQAMPPKDRGDVVTSMTWTGKAEDTSTQGAPLSSRNNPAPLHTTTHIKPEVFDFAADTRSWNLQERLLSRRLLHLAGEQMYWECNALKASETFPRGLPPLLWEKVHTKSTPTPISTSLSTTTTAPAPMPTSKPKLQSTSRTRPFGPRLLRNCQYIRKQGDGLGDPMAAQMALQIGSDDKEKPFNLSIKKESGLQSGENGMFNQSGGVTPVLGSFGSGLRFEFDFGFEVPAADAAGAGARLGSAVESEEGESVGVGVGVGVVGCAGVKVDEDREDVKMKM